MDINGNLKTPCNIYGICGYKQSGKNTVAKIWQLLDFYYKMGKDYWVKFASIENSIENYTDTQYVLENLQFENKNFSWKQKSYAHKLKQILCIFFGCKMEDFESEGFKNSKVPEEWKVWKVTFSTEVTFEPSITEIFSSKEEALKRYNELDNLDYWVCEPTEHLPTYREVLQYIGTDLFRNQLHPNIWVNATMVDYRPIDNRTIQDPDDSNIEYPDWIITDIRFQNEADAVTERGGRLIKVIRYKVGDKVWFNDEAGLYEDKNQSGEYEIIGIHSNEEYLISNGTTEMGAWNYEINHINKDTHASEVEQDSIPVYYTIHNCTTLEDLIENVKYIMIEEGVIEV